MNFKTIAKQRWPQINDETEITYFARYAPRAYIPDYKKFPADVEEVELESFSDGNRKFFMGYSPRLNVLVIVKTELDDLHKALRE